MMKKRNVPFIQPELLMKARYGKRNHHHSKSTFKQNNPIDHGDDPFLFVAQRESSRLKITERLTGPTRSQVELQHKENLRIQARLLQAKSKVDTSSPQQYQPGLPARPRRQARASCKKLNQSMPAKHSPNNTS